MTSSLVGLPVCPQYAHVPATKKNRPYPSDAAGAILESPPENAKLEGGYALPTLLKRWTPLAASFALGRIWAVWHLPLFFLSGVVQFHESFVVRRKRGRAFDPDHVGLYSYGRKCVSRDPDAFAL
jgi:hypothetical protein